MPSTTTQHLQSQPTTPVAARPSRSAAVVALQSRALAHDTLAASGLAVVNELALQLGCERVTLALGPPQRLRVRAV